MKKYVDNISLNFEYHCSVEKLWLYLTKVDLMKKWFFENISNFIAEPGFKTQFVVKSENRSFTHNWEVSEVVPFERIKWNWNYIEYAGDASVTFILKKENDQSTLTFYMEILEDFPADIPEFARESCINGWQYFLKERLGVFINSQT